MSFNTDKPNNDGSESKHRYHVRYRYTNKTAGLGLPASGRGDHEIVLDTAPSADQLFEAAKQHIIAGMEQQQWTDNEVVIIDAYPL